VGGPPPHRQSCCLMYALPGLDACAGCPRRP
ncbi:(2Fe-2S)-binding protein, partial [Janibacter corallicola]